MRIYDFVGTVVVGWVKVKCYSFGLEWEERVPSLPDLSDDGWRERADEVAVCGSDSCFRFDLGEGRSLYVDCDAIAPYFATINKRGMREHLKARWYSLFEPECSEEEWLAAWGMGASADRPRIVP